MVVLYVGFPRNWFGLANIRGLVTLRSLVRDCMAQLRVWWFEAVEMGIFSAEHVGVPQVMQAHPGGAQTVNWAPGGMGRWWAPA